MHVIVDGAGTNSKVLKDVSKTANDADKEKKLPDAALKFEPYFVHNDDKYFTLFACLMQ